MTFDEWWKQPDGPDSSGVKAQARAAWNAAMEEAAKVCDGRAKTWDGDPPDGDETVYAFRSEEADNCAAAIRKLK